MRLFAKKTRILIVGDEGPVLAKLRARIELFWPAEIPMKIVAVFCGWADEAIDSIADYRPDILLLAHAFRRDEKTGRDVARWIDEHYQAPIHVAVHGDLAGAELRQLFEGARCVTHFISGEGVRDFLRDCIPRERSES
ncbi:MAG: hypothetical protein IT294_17450 [Deltaproteobacteria bacterium]|nr:hypothetical protein [Deltaproteobacteria bacterium]